MKTGVVMTTDDDVRDGIWTDLYRKIVMLLRRHGTEEPTGDGDFWVVDDNYGWRRHTVIIFALKMLDLAIVTALRDLLTHLPDWEIFSLSMSRTKKTYGRRWELQFAEARLSTA